MDKRNTVQRSIILETVRNLQSHATADEIYENIAEKHPSISKGTVYRNLRLLSETGAIQKVEIPAGADRYDHACHDHYHAQCVVCGQVFDVDMDFIDDLETRVKNSHGFVFKRHDIVFKGVCPECNKTDERMEENEQFKRNKNGSQLNGGICG